MLFATVKMPVDASKEIPVIEGERVAVSDPVPPVHVYAVVVSEDP